MVPVGAQERPCVKICCQGVAERGPLQIAPVAGLLRLGGIVGELGERPATGNVALGVAVEGRSPRVRREIDVRIALGDADVVEEHAGLDHHGGVAQVARQGAVEDAPPSDKAAESALDRDASGALVEVEGVLPRVQLLAAVRSDHVVRGRVRLVTGDPETRGHAALLIELLRK